MKTQIYPNLLKISSGRNSEFFGIIEADLLKILKRQTFYHVVRVWEIRD